jgi:hypothetical protein
MTRPDRTVDTLFALSAFWRAIRLSTVFAFVRLNTSTIGTTRRWPSCTILSTRMSSCEKFS